MAIYKKIKGKDTKVAENSVIDHSQLSGRDEYGAHSISAIRKLPEKLTDLKNKSITNEQAIKDEHDRAVLREDTIEDNAQRISLVDNNNGTLTFTNYDNQTNTVKAGHLVDNTTIKEIDNNSTLEVIGVKGTFIKDNVSITKTYDAEDIYDDIESAKGIKLEQVLDNQNNPTGELKFTDYTGNETTVQGGFLADEDTITINSNNKIALKKVYVDSDTLVGDGASSNSELNAKAIKDSNGTITVSNVNNMKQQIDAIEGRGGYLRPYDFNYIQPNLYTDTGNGIVTIASLNKMFDANGQIVPYVSGEGDLIITDAIEYDAEDKATSNSILSLLTQYALQEIDNDKNAVDIFNGTRVTNLENNHTWILNNTPDTDPKIFEWVDLGQSLVSIATTDTLGVVLSSEDDLKVSVNNQTGIMSVNGLSELADRVGDTTLTTTAQNLSDAVNELNSDKQENLVNQVNIKSVNSNSLLGSGNLELSTYLPFPNTWTTTGTVVNLFTSIENDSSAIVGKAYLGEVTCSDLPFSGNAELVIEIMNGTGVNKVIVATLTSSNIAPYYWQYTYGNGHDSGWQTFISEDNSIPKFDSTVSYNVGDLVTYEGIFYKCTTAHIGAWYSVNFTRINLKDLFDSKQNIITGAASSVVTNNLTGNRVVVTDTNGKISASTVTSEEIGYLSGVTSDIQTQLNNLDTAIENKVVMTIHREEFSITNNLTNCTTDNTQTVISPDEPYIANITPITDYTLSGASVTVIMRGVDVTSSVYNNGTINIQQVTGDITITISAVIIMYSITNTLINCTSDNNAQIIQIGLPYSATITPDADCTLTDAQVSITMGGTDVTSTAYNNGVISIASVTGDLVVYIKARLNIQLTAYATPQSGVTYTPVTDLTSYTDEQINAISKAISNNANITSSTQTVYLSDETSISIGATRSYTLSTQEAMTDRILGFNHDTLTNANAYGEATATGKAGMTWQMVNCLATLYKMNSSNTNAGGWNASLMRTSTLPTIKSLLPSDLQSVIKTVDKKAANGGYTNYSATITSTDDLFLLAEIEIFGSVTYAQDGSNEGTQYAYWVGKSASDRIKYYDNAGTPTANLWWERSSIGATGFCCVNTSGSTYNFIAGNSHGVAFAYCT